MIFVISEYLSFVVFEPSIFSPYLVLNISLFSPIFILNMSSFYLILDIASFYLILDLSLFSPILADLRFLLSRQSHLSRIGCDVEATDDGMIIRGGRPLHGAAVDSHKDHRVAMSLAVAALACSGEMEIRDSDCVTISYPGFYQDLQMLCR